MLEGTTRHRHLSVDSRKEHLQKRDWALHCKSCSKTSFKLLWKEPKAPYRYAHLVGSCEGCGQEIILTYQIPAEDILEGKKHFKPLVLWKETPTL